MISWKYIRGAGEVELSRKCCVVWRVLFYATICCGTCEILGAVLEGGGKGCVVVRIRDICSDEWVRNISHSAGCNVRVINLVWRCRDVIGGEEKGVIIG